MSDTQTGKPSIGSQIPYRRDQVGRKTGSLVFDQHLNETLADGPERPVAQAAANPLKHD